MVYFVCMAKKPIMIVNDIDPESGQPEVVDFDLHAEDTAIPERPNEVAVNVKVEADEVHPAEFYELPDVQGTIARATDTDAEERRKAIKMCNDIMKDKEMKPLDRLGAMDRIAKMKRWYEAPKTPPGSGTPDPAWFVQYVKNLRRHLGMSEPDATSFTATAT